MINHMSPLSVHACILHWQNESISCGFAIIKNIVEQWKLEWMGVNRSHLLHYYVQYYSTTTSTTSTSNESETLAWLMDA